MNTDNKIIVLRDYLGIDDPYFDMADLGLPEVVVVPSDDDDICKYLSDSDQEMILC